MFRSLHQWCEAQQQNIAFAKDAKTMDFHTNIFTCNAKFTPTSNDMADKRLLGLRAQKDELVEGDDAISVRIGFLEESKNFSVTNVAAAVSIRGAKQV